LIMAGMAIFFGYYTAAYTATTILKEQEEGTLARLFTTPTSKATILGGKFLAVFITCGIQLPVLLVLSALLFKIHWGNPVLLAVTVFSQVVAASGFGVFIISFVKNTRQSGAVLGGLLTVLGMLGGLFTTMVQGLPQVFQVINLLTPHGWALKSWRLVLGGAGLPDLALPSLVLLAIGAVTFGAGVLRFRRRLA
jgi:ABC-2 type transport system permease protein